MANLNSGEVLDNREGPGAGPVGRIGIAIVTSYLVLLSSALLYCLIVLWPPPPSSTVGAIESTGAAIEKIAGTPQPPNDPNPNTRSVAKTSGPGTGLPRVREADPSEITFVVWRFSPDEETRMVLLVVCAGALGSVVHSLRSVYWYAGNRNLIWSWVPKYLIQPFGASVLAVVFYLVIRGGFFSAEAGFEHISPFGFMALSAIVWMFSEQAVLKLKEISETLLSKPPPGKNAEPQHGRAKSFPLNRSRDQR
jgi:hypothetical protein